VTASFQVHALKPEKAIYRDALSKLDIQPEDCVYIDDVEQYAEAAAGLAMKAIHYRSAEGLRSSLKTLLA
jgi:putative hydrolase of the HAD superfamily